MDPRGESRFPHVMRGATWRTRHCVKSRSEYALVKTFVCIQKDGACMRSHYSERIVAKSLNPKAS